MEIKGYSIFKYVSDLLWSVVRDPVVLGSAPWTEIVPSFIYKKQPFSQKQNILKPLLKYKAVGRHPTCFYLKFETSKSLQ